MAQDEQKENLTLWNAAVCPFGQRAWFTILEKGIPCEFKWIDLKNKSQEFSEKYKVAENAEDAMKAKGGAVPVIQHGNKIITDSKPVAEYLAQTFKETGRSLLPENDDAQKLMDEKFGQHFWPVFKALYALVKLEDPKGSELLKQMKLLNDTLKASSKEGFLFGKSMTLFDIFVFPIFYRFQGAENAINFPLASEWLKNGCGNDENNNKVEFNRLKNWCDTLESLESVKEMRKISTNDIFEAYFGGIRNDAIKKKEQANDEQKDNK